jgi:hypothetical protein
MYRGLDYVVLFLDYIILLIRLGLYEGLIFIQVKPWNPAC